ncbi:nicotinamide N-methyltransferase-like protein, partial [Naematelia encephala]
DPNFPPNLSIKPYSIGFNDSNATAQAGAIDKYGIAGRVWEAGKPLLEYLTPGKDFDPPCSLFSGGHQRVLELGSGQSVPSLRLATYLTPADLVVLTDLPNVVPLCHQAVKAHVGSIRARVVVEPLAWGEDASMVKRLGPFTHILCCDLIYFPHLYPSLLLTLLELTEREPSEEDTFGPEVILAYQSRSLALEHSFFDAFELYFRMQPV